MKNNHMMKHFVIVTCILTGIAVCVVNAVYLNMDMVTVAFLIAMLAVIILSYITGIRKACLISAELEKAAASIQAREDRDIDKNLFEKDYLNSRMDAYLSGRRAGSSRTIRRFINSYDIGNYIGKEILENVPNLLTSLGILGTFIGLILGLRDFNFNDTTVLADVVSQLVKGIQVAFWTSVDGIALAMLYSIAWSVILNRLTLAIESFLESYDSLEAAKAPDGAEAILETQSSPGGGNPEDASVQQLEQMQQMMDKFAAQLEEILKRLPGTIADELRGGLAKELQNARTQLTAINQAQEQYLNITRVSIEEIKTGAADLVQSADAQAKSMEELTQSCTEAMREMISTGIDGVTGLFNTGKDNATELMQYSSDVLKENLQRNEKVMSDLKQIFEEVAVTDLAQALNDLAAEVKESQKKRGILGWLFGR